MLGKYIIQSGDIRLQDWERRAYLDIRQDLCIYKIDKNNLDQENVVPAYKVSFSYPEQTAFPPKKSKLFYDVEFFLNLKTIFIFLLKIGAKDLMEVVLYTKFPIIQATIKRFYWENFKTCGNYNHWANTIAAMSPDESKVIIFSQDKIWLFENFDRDNFLNGTQTQLNLNHFS